MYYEERPQLVTVCIGSRHYSTINYFIEESGDGFEVESVTVATASPLSEEHYSTIVSAIVRARYSEDDVEAIICNWSVTPRTEAAKAEMRELQEWRAMAKARAKEAIEYAGAAASDALR